MMQQSDLDSRLDSLKQSMLSIVRSLAAGAGIKTEAEARALLRTGPHDRVYVATAKQLASKAYGRPRLASMMLPPYTDEEMRRAARVFADTQKPVKAKPPK